MTENGSYTGPADAPVPVSPWTPEQLALLPHDNAGMRLVVSIWVLNFLALAFLLARVYCKFLRHRGLWWDDGVLIAAYVCSTIETALLSYSVKLGYGYHIWDMPPELFPYVVDLLKVINLAGTFSLTAAIWSKTSFALTLLRLTQGWLKLVVWFIIISMNIAMGLSALFVWVQCTPIEKSWNPFIDGTCWPPYVLVHYNIFSAAYSAAMDISLALLPWKLIWGLQMKRQEKIGVAFAMSCGVFAGITAIIKTTKIPAMLSQDPYDGVDLFIWGNAESCVTIIAASVPILRVLIRDVKTSYRNYYVSEQNDNNTAPNRSRTRGQNSVVVTAGRRSHNPSTNKLDDGSEKSILDGRASPGKIVRRNEIVVEYQDRKDGESVEYELGHIPA
ncbi:hypothetical protein CONLIGDRAFT_655703 [Coniochaeta ligniaria NRRL 30616]|uniref:Rhodopsin domain-containing protein n=1 Tax=Coniochaeta ligniaria NRRL 30616 TaxID=1408157 RepID=A0A1J7ILG7_9PEZI|nr:hypothetical protein CONLIGDRAFT_655703 [Coniochaeta ligniaria NRRL 30616]